MMLSWLMGGRAAGGGQASLAGMERIGNRGYDHSKGARDLSIADKVGLLTPCKRADLILVRSTDINMAPVGDPFDALVALARPTNVDTVVVDGRMLRRDNRFTALDHAEVASAAADTAAALRVRAKWP